MINHAYFRILTAVVCLFVPMLAFGAGNASSSVDISKQVEDMQKAHPNYALAMIMPVNVADDKINLLINIPETFKKLDNPQGGLIEFIPKEDKDPYAWSEIITIVPFIGKGVKAEAIVRALAKKMEDNSKDYKLLAEEFVKHDKYEEGRALVVYTYNGRRELLKIYAASGPYDCVMVQDAVLLKSDDDIERNRKKLDDFFQKSVKIMKGTEFPK